MPFQASQAAFAAALLHADLPIPGGVTNAHGAADAARFAVYRNNVFVSLTRALAQRFPVTERLVGSGLFAAVARSFAQDHKPASPVMTEYGDTFPDFIAAFGPASGLPYLPDVARIEAAWTRAYHAADAAAMTVADLAGIAPEALPGLRFAAHPSARLIRSRFPAGSIWAAHQQAEVAPVPALGAETVLLVRPAGSVGVHILPSRDAGFAGALLAGQNVNEAVTRALAADAGFDFGAALIALITLGALRAPHPDTGDFHDPEIVDP